MTLIIVDMSGSLRTGQHERETCWQSITCGKEKVELKQREHDTRPTRSNAAAEPEAATPATKRRESPGKTRPMSRPVSAKRIARMPTKPRSATIESAWSRVEISIGVEATRPCP